MTASRPDNEAIFHAARDIPDSDHRREYVREVCGGDETRIAYVEALLAAADAPDSLLDRPAVDATRTGPSEPNADLPLDFLAPSESPGSLGRLGHYEVKEVIGRGGMGIVLRALDEKLHRVVAIKVIAAQLATNANARKRFTREAQAQAAVSHDHIVTIHAVEEARGLPYLVMQYVSGMSLHQRLDRDGPLTLQEILRIGMQTASGLAAAHAQGLVHRDVKPANILLENGVERVKLTDFGLARAAADAQLTQSGVVTGTPQYMSPEQAEGKAIDQRTDLFSLGSVLYAMCTGRAPFRASGTMAVLKRVCEETPSPIREANPEIPDWLVAIIDKLHAKDPADRYQSAAEVAELLGRHLAHVQHPSVVGQVSNLPVERQAGWKPAPRHHRWVIAAGVLLSLVAGLALTEATGVTNLRATVIRIFTPDGTLVVETNDPDVKVTIEGDGGLVITGAGPQEVRLKPGSYKIQATKDGKLVRNELVTISRGDKQVVRVSLEPVVVQPVERAERGAFVLLSDTGSEIRKFDTLNDAANAANAASDGDTIEIRGNGPFLAKHVRIERRALTIRAGAGYRPLLQIAPELPDYDLISTSGPLVLEGLDLRCMHREVPNAYSVIWTNSASVHLANCRLTVEQPSKAKGVFMLLAHSKVVLRNCEFHEPEIAIVSFPNHAPIELVMDNCLGVGQGGAAGLLYEHSSNEVFMQFTRNTLVSPWFANVGFAVAPAPTKPGKGATERKRLRFEMSSSVLDVREGMLIVQGNESLKANWETAEDAEAFIKPCIQWREQGNLYSPGGAAIKARSAKRDNVTLSPGDLKGWQHLWNLTNTGSVQGPIRFQGGDLLVKLRNTPERITPDDFRLRPDSAGYRAGKDGKDLGADVDLVGPGAAYERWKKTPEYQQWLKETKQRTKVEVPKAEPKAFVLLGGKGVAERKFDTLAEAVLGASDGDTIEIHGNGPFVTPPVHIHGTRLTIRAAEGFRPSIVFDIAVEDYGLRTDADLLLEGLELRNRRPGKEDYLISAAGPSLRLLNCRLLILGPAQCVSCFSPVLIARNCEILSSNSHQGVLQDVATGEKTLFENCILTGNTPFCLSTHRLKRLNVELKRNTFLAGLGSEATIFCNFTIMPDLRKPLPTGNPVRLAAADNVFAAPATLLWQQHSTEPEWRPVKGAEAEAQLARLIDWRDSRNVYAPRAPSVHWSIDGNALEPHGPKNLAEWNRFWKLTDTASLEGPVRFEGGNLRTRLAETPEKLTPSDFRLRADSAGYKAGKDGKDLGADVDLVGPGPAYERWKKTAEYQQWLKETKQTMKAEAPKAEPKAFVLLGGKGVAERKFDTLAEAVLGASDGDTIELRGNGPFVSEPIKVNSGLAIRAGEGFRPVIKLRPDRPGTDAPLLVAGAPLVLEGLEFQRIFRDLKDRQTILMTSKHLHAANCRFVTGENGACIVTSSPFCQLRNCEFLCSWGSGTVWWEGRQSDHRLVIDNCVHSHGVGITYETLDSKGPVVHINRNTFGSVPWALTLELPVDRARKLEDAEARSKALRLEASENVLDGGFVALLQPNEPAEALPPAEAEKHLARLVGWRGERNLFVRVGSLLKTSAGQGVNQKEAKPAVMNLDDWRRFWKTAEANSIEGRVRYQGGDLQGKWEAAPEQMTPDDFRLRPDSAGYKAGKDGKDLGADVDLVGPGPAYERWKKTPDYQQWLKETGQKK